MNVRIALPLSILAATALLGACRPTGKKPSNANAPASSNAVASPLGTSAPNPIIELADAGVTMAHPDGFTHEKDEDDVILKAPGESFEIVVNVPDDAEFEDVREDAAQEIDDYVIDVTFIDKDVASKANAFDTASFSGTGKDRDTGKEVSWTMTLIKTDKKPVEVIASGDKETLERNAGKVAAFINSIQMLQGT